jgi:hypothetical protein
MGGQDNTAQYVASFKVQGRGKWSNEMDLPIEAGFSKAQAAIEYQLAQLASADDSMIAILDLALFAEYQWFWQASITLDAPVIIEFQQQQVIVRNTSTQSTAEGFFSWRGNSYRLPSLQPGQIWRPESQAIIQDTELAISILQRQTQAYDAGLIIPFSVQILVFETDHQSWLFIHGRQQGQVL